MHGAPDERLGEVVCAVIYPQADCLVTASDIQEHVRAHLAAFKVPSQVRFVDRPLPRIASGKFDKRAVRDETIACL